MKNKGKIKIIAIILAAAIVVAAGGAITCKTVLKSLYPLKYTEYVSKYSKFFAVDEALLYAVIKTESSFDPEAVSSAGAVGLTQITPETFDWLRIKLCEETVDVSLTDPETSIKYGAFFLSYLLQEFGDTETALAAYHAGRGRVNEWLDDPSLSPDGRGLDSIPVKETAHYVHKVTNAINIYVNLYSLGKEDAKNER